MRNFSAPLQRKYYERTSLNFDEWHLRDVDEHHSALRWIDFLFPPEKIDTILDVGMGTGRAVEFFNDRNRSVVGVELVAAQIVQARRKGISPRCLIQADGTALPFANNSFDAVCEFGMLHHVEHPDRVISEMFRVARKAVFISDSNRFGQGNVFGRLLKLALYKLGFWRLADYLRTGGKGFHLSERDGVFYSFSIYDHLQQISQSAEHVWVLPVTHGDRRLGFDPLLTHGHVLLCAFKKGFAPPLGTQIS